MSVCKKAGDGTARRFQFLRVRVSEGELLLFKAFEGQVPLFALRDARSRKGAVEVNAPLAEVVPEEVIVRGSKGDDVFADLGGVRRGDSNPEGADHDQVLAVQAADESDGVVVCRAVIAPVGEDKGIEFFNDLIVYVADIVGTDVPRHVGPYNIRYINDEVIEKFDTFILSYWCNHGTADDDTIALIRRLHGKNLIVIGTLGVAVTTAHAAKVCENVIALASADNHLLGHYLCQGSIDLNRTFARTRIPEGEKGHLSLERFEKQKLSLGHPNAEELEAARRAVAGFLADRQ